MKDLQIMMDEKLLRRLDPAEEVRRSGRSAVLRWAAVGYLRPRPRRPDRGQTPSRLRQQRILDLRVRRLRRGACVARQLNRSEIWGYRSGAPDKWHPALILKCQQAIGLLHAVMVAPVTSTIYGAPSEVVVGIDEGLKRESSVNLDYVQTVEQSRLIRYILRLPPAKMRRICRAPATAVACDVG